MNGIPVNGWDDNSLSQQPSPINGWWSHWGEKPVSVIDIRGGQETDEFPIHTRRANAETMYEHDDSQPALGSGSRKARRNSGGSPRNAMGYGGPPAAEQLSSVRNDMRTSDSGVEDVHPGATQQHIGAGSIVGVGRVRPRRSRPGGIAAINDSQVESSQ